MKMSYLMHQCRRELVIHIREPRALLFSSLFFLMVTVFFPLTISPNPILLRQVAPGLIWIALLLAMLMAAERIFQNDYLEGLLEQWLTAGSSVYLLTLVKVFIHWCLTLLPILLLCPFVGVLFDLSIHENVVLMISLILGSPAILFLCALAAAFTTSAQQKGMLIALILLPLSTPMMIFGSATLTAAMHGLNVTGYQALLLAFSLIAVTFLPWAITAVIRISLAD